MAGTGVPAEQILRFRGYELNPGTGELRKGPTVVRLSPQPCRLLTMLVNRAGTLVTREEIRQQIWGEETFVDFELALNYCVNRIRSALEDSVRSPRYIETLPRRGYRFIAPVETAQLDSPCALAVLPFENLNRNPDQDYFADGVTDALITELGKISSLRVISRQSVLHLKQTRRKLSDIGRELGVNTVVEGSALIAGRRVRISAQLLRVHPEQHLWAESFECDMKEILALQGELARTIAEQVRVALKPGDLSRLSRGPVNMEAHEAFLKGRYHAGKWTEEGIRKGLEYFQQAIQRDPAYAPAYAGLSDSLSLLGFWGHAPIREVYPAAKQAAVKALELDDSSSLAHSALAWIRWLYDWDLKACEQEVLRAIALNPSNEAARLLYAAYLATIGLDRKGAVAETRLALQVDPVSLYANSTAAWIYLFAREYPMAVEQACRTLEAYPDSLQARYVLGWAHLGMSMSAAAVEDFRKAADISRDATTLGYLGHALSKAGKKTAAKALLRELHETSKSRYVPPKSFVSLYVGLGNYDRAFEYLARAYEERDSMLFWLRAVPLFDPLRSDPRFKRLLRLLGLPKI